MPLMQVPMPGCKARIPHEALFFRKVIFRVIGELIEQGPQCRVVGPSRRNQGLAESIDQLHQTTMLLVDALKSGGEMSVPSEGFHGFVSLHILREALIGFRFATHDAEFCTTVRK